jgi:hypothetical protein
MGNKRTVRLAWALCGLTTCLAVVLFAAGLLNQNGSKNALQLAYDALVFLALPVVFVILAALALGECGRHRLGCAVRAY